MDAPLESLRTNCTIPPLPVSILVLMDAPLEYLKAIMDDLKFGVSILVLMDAPLECEKKGLANSCVTCFNPCFNGCAS